MSEAIRPTTTAFDHWNFARQRRFVKQFLQNEPLIEERLQIRKSQKNPQILVDSKIFRIRYVRFYKSAKIAYLNSMYSN